MILIQENLSAESRPKSENILNHQWERSGSVLDSRPRGSGFEPHRLHCVVVLEQDTLILA